MGGAIRGARSAPGWLGEQRPGEVRPGRAQRTAPLRRSRGHQSRHSSFSGGIGRAACCQPSSVAQYRRGSGHSGRLLFGRGHAGMSRSATGLTSRPSAKLCPRSPVGVARSSGAARQLPLLAAVPARNGRVPPPPFDGVGGSATCHSPQDSGQAVRRRSSCRYPADAVMAGQPGADGPGPRSIGAGAGQPGTVRG